MDFSLSTFSFFTKVKMNHMRATLFNLASLPLSFYNQKILPAEQRANDTHRIIANAQAKGGFGPYRFFLYSYQSTAHITKFTVQCFRKRRIGRLHAVAKEMPNCNHNAFHSWRMIACAMARPVKVVTLHYCTGRTFHLVEDQYFCCF